jgi:CRISPR/Cas system-associated endonuclease Cas1
MNAPEAELVENLARLEQTNDHIERNKLALDLAETRDPRVFDALLRLIQRKDLENRRGTLVYCLENYDCSSVRDLLAHLAETGNLEVAAGAQLILEEQGLA